MGNGYYEHDVEVRFVEGLLDASTEWQWFVDYTESNFDSEIELSNFDDFLDAYSKIGIVYEHFVRLFDQGLLPNEAIEFKANWCKEVFDMAQIRSLGAATIKKNIEPTFFGAFYLVAYVTNIINRITEEPFIINTELFFTSNAFQLYDLASVERELEDILVVFVNASFPGSERAIDCFRDNLAQRMHLENSEAVNSFLDDFFTDNFLDYRGPDRVKYLSWQENLLFEMTKTSLADGKLMPQMQFNGIGYPDFRGWTEIRLESMLGFFSDYRAKCMVESVRYILFSIIPSEETVTLIFQKQIDCIEAVIAAKEPLQKANTTFFQISLMLIDDEALDRDIAKAHLKKLGRVLSSLNEAGDIRFAIEHRLPINKTHKDIVIKDALNRSKTILNSISRPCDLAHFFQDKIVERHCCQNDAEKALLLLEQFANKGGIEVADLFFHALRFYIGLLHNSNIDNVWIRKVLISLRNTWEESFYKSTLDEMQVISHEGSISCDEISGINKALYDNPISFARSMFPLSDSYICEELESISEHILPYLFTRINISKFYPDQARIRIDDEHPIDGLMQKTVMRVYEKNAYRMMNRLDMEEVLLPLYENINFRIDFVAHFVDAEKAYKTIAKAVEPRYVLLDYPTSRPSLGHTLQLFPILENAIRKIGEYYSVVPFQMEKEKFTILLSASSVIKKVVSELFETTETLDGANDLLCVYHIMYSSNGLNIRNECVHGRGYQSPKEIEKAFKLTVICTYIMFERLNILRKNSVSVSLVEDEGTSCKTGDK